MSRIAWWYLRPSPTTRTRCNPSMSRPILTCRATVWCGMHALNSFSTVHCVLQAPKASPALTYSDSHKEVSLVYFSTFEPIELTPDSIMQQAGVPMLYDSASNPRLPCLYRHLPRGQRTWARPPHSVLHRRQQSPDNSTQLQERSAPWRCLCRYAARQGQR